MMLWLAVFLGLFWIALTVVLWRMRRALDGGSDDAERGRG